MDKNPRVIRPSKEIEERADSTFQEAVESQFSEELCNEIDKIVRIALDERKPNFAMRHPVLTALAVYVATQLGHAAYNELSDSFFEQPTKIVVFFDETKT